MSAIAKHVWSTEYVHADGLRERWFDDLDHATAILESIPYDLRGEHTKHAPLQTSPSPGLWRIDDRQLAGTTVRVGWSTVR